MFVAPACAAFAKGLQLVTTAGDTSGAKLLQSGSRRIVEFLRCLAGNVAGLLSPEITLNNRLDAINFLHIFVSGT